MSTDTRKSKPKSSGVVALVSVAALMTTLPADAVQSYIATPLGSLGGTYWGVPVSRAYAINAFGHVTGEARIPTTPESSGSHAFIHANGAMIDLGTLGGQSIRQTKEEFVGIIGGIVRRVVDITDGAIQIRYDFPSIRNGQVGLVPLPRPRYSFSLVSKLPQTATENPLYPAVNVGCRTTLSALYATPRKVY